MSNFFKHKMRGKSPGEIAGMIIFGIIAITGLAILFGFVLMWLWNWLMPELFDLPTVTYWQAVGLFILLKILLGGCGSGGSKCSSSKDKTSCKKEGKRDFSKWKHYDKFWEEEGNKAYENYLNRLTQEQPNND
ncbi:hypothetical protein EYD45_06480 [Hyunsoonleella flava]|uniref:Uncharacterized protein n=1 Tax=Hyunsoonleella flava TaxID=2527939 RepID=A0A4V2JA96_9FLAO|nr:hypothetical protein [Hyunsoonleella flava]TBN04904.1 hypothetical protein EYD45_06480 [Hyunsoonleella flava]